MIKLYKNYKDYSEQEQVHRHTAKTRVEQGLEDGTIIKVPKGTKYIGITIR